MKGIRTWTTTIRAFWFGLLLGGFVMSFALLAVAEWTSIDPNGDGTVSATQVSCGGLGNYDCLDDGVATTSSPNTGSDYLDFGLGDVDFYQMETVGDVDTVSQVDVHLYHTQTSSNIGFNVSLYAANETTQYGATVSFANRTVAGWDTSTFSGLSLTQSQLDGLRVRVECYRISGGQPQQCRNFALYADVTYSKLIEVTVGATGSQQNLDVGTTSAHVGGTFTITENVGSRSVTSITITETGTVDAQNDLDNIELYYDLDTTSPYDCASETYDGTESQFGATDTGGFSGANGTSTFTGTAGISTTATMCVYPVLDVGVGASAGQTLELQIADPSVDVVADGGADVSPASTVALSGTTILQAPQLDQIHYHWRNDDGGESGATSATGETEDTTYDTFPKQTTKRLRLEVSNEGNASTPTASNILDPMTTGNTKTVSDGSNRLLLVAVHSEDSGTNVDVDSVTYGGQTLTEVSDQQIGSGFSNGLWVGYLDEAGIRAASGITISPSWNGVPDEAVLYNSIVFENVDQNSPIPEWSGNTAASVSTIQPTSSIAVADGDTAVYFTTAGAAGQSHTPATGYTEGTEESSGGSGSTAANAYQAITAAGTEQPTADWSLTQSRALITAVTVQFGHNYRLEYATKVTTCSAIADSGWSDVGASGGEWDMAASQLTEGADTTNITVGSGGVTDENITFLTPNGAQRENTSETGPLPLSASEFVELEYALAANAGAAVGTTYCFRVANQQTSLDTYTVYPEATILADVTVSQSGTQQATVSIPSTDVEAGAYFTVTDNIAGDTTVQSITLTASGTVDYQNDIDNVRLYYDLDTTSPYDCASESYAGTEPQFGSTAVDGFSANGTSTFSGSQVINPTQTMCVYTVYDVADAASNDETFELRIADASTDVTVDAGSVAPSSLVDLSGVTTFVSDAVSQVHYHWRNDDGDESGATSATGGSEDTTLENLRRTVPKRVRIGVANEGSATSPAHQYRLEYALRVSTCGAATGWTDVGAANDTFNMFDSLNITDGNDTTNLAITNGGVTDVGDTFLSNNNAVKDTSSQTGGIALPGKNFVDLEFSIVASTTATAGATYCFRVTDAGTPIDGYDQYPKVSIKPKTDFFIQRGVTTVSGTSATINAGTEYTAPAASTSAFIRIVGTNNIGGGSSSNSGNTDDVTVYVSNPSNIRNSITFTRPATAADTTRVAWEIIEYVGASGGDNEIIVRQQSTITYGSTALSATTSAAAGIVDDADVAVFITGQLNPDTTTNYPYSLSTAAWNSGADTATFTRGASGNAAGASYAVVEFTGENWNVQRSEHTYTAAGSTETEPITAVNSLARTFIHTQKRVGSGLNNHSDFGHNVWLSGIGQVSYLLDSGASTPGSHASVAWVIENTQTVGDSMIVTRSNGTQSGGTAPQTVNVNIGATISDTQDASLLLNNFGDEEGSGGGKNSFPEPIMSTRIISDTQYELWIAQPDNDSRTWRAEVVEWPTAARDIAQNYYRFYADNDALDPTDPWPEGVTDIGENTEVTELDGPIAKGENLRLRMTLQISSARMESDIDSFTLQYAERDSTCSAIGEGSWHDVGGVGSTTALWRGTTTSQADGTALSSDPPTAGDLNISVADVAGTFEEENSSALTPYPVDPGEDVEYDWAVQHNGAKEKTSYCFRMIESNGTLFESYNFYPTMRTAGYTPTLSQWRFYDDETSLTPTSPLAGENTAPTDLAFDNIIKLRTTVAEQTGGEGTDIKFKLQYSESSDFTEGVHDVVASSTCEASATTSAQLWCYDDGAGVDNAVIDSAVLSDADNCSGGSGNGCGTHNEGPASSTATYDQPSYSTAEYEFTLRHDGARANAVYYFRLYDVTNATTVAASSSYPSLVTEGAALTFSLGGLPAGTTTESITTDAPTTPNAVAYGSVPIDTEYEAAHRLTVDTNATEGYQVLVYTTQDLLNTYGTAIDPVSASNSTPAGWGDACASGTDGCFGYHTGDAVLDGGSTRFFADDSYAAFETSAREVMYSSVPTTDTHDLIYKLQVGSLQPAGTYESEVVYIAIPTF